MGQIYISLLLRSVTKMRFTHANKPMYVRKQREVPKKEEFQLHLLLALSPFRLGGDEEVLFWDSDDLKNFQTNGEIRK